MVKEKGIEKPLRKMEPNPSSVDVEIESSIRKEGLHDGNTSLDFQSTPKVEMSTKSRKFPSRTHIERYLQDSHELKNIMERGEHKFNHEMEIEEDCLTSGKSNSQNVQKRKELSSNYRSDESAFTHSSTSGWMEENESISDESYNNDLLGYDSTDLSESVDLSELNSIRDDIISSDDEDKGAKKHEQDPDDSEDEQERWDRISRTVERMKLLLMKYPKFTGRVGNNNIIKALHAMMDTLVERKSPTSADIKMVEEQMENFKSVLFAGIEEDLVKWKHQRRSYRFYVMRCFMLLAILAAVTSFVYKYSLEGD